MDLALIAIAVAIAVLVSLPTRAAARQLVRRWLEVDEPTPGQVDRAWRHLLRRRAPLVVVAAAVFWTLASLPMTSGWAVVGALLLTVLVCEAVAVLVGRPPRERDQNGTRPVAPGRYALGSLVPRYALVVLGALTGLTLALVMIGSAARPLVERALAATPPEYQRQAAGSGWSSPFSSTSVLLGWTVVVMVAVGIVLWLSSCRVVDDDETMDLVFRTRAARVATGLGVLQLGALGAAAANMSFDAAVVLTGSRPDGSGPIGAFGGDGSPMPRWLEVSANVSMPLGLVMTLTGLVVWRWITTAQRPTPQRSPR